MRTIFSLSNILSEFKYSIRLAIPLIASELTYAANGFIATIMIAHLGKNQLAANALVWSIYITVALFFIGILSAVSIMIAQSFGAKDKRSVSACFKQGLIMAIIFALPMMLIMWASPIVLVWTGQDQAVIECAKPFFYVLIWSMLPLNIIIVIEQFLLGINKTRLVMMVSIISVPISILFYYTFLFGKLGLPKLGLAGVGYSILVTNGLMALYLIGYIYFSNQFQVYKLFKKWWVVNRKILLELIRIGIPLGFMYCIEVALFAAIAIMMGTLGTTTLAAYQIAYQYMMLALMILFAMGQAATVRVGNEVGKNNRESIKLTSAVNIGIGMGFMLLFSVFYIGFAHWIIGLSIDIHEESLQSMANQATTFLPIAGVLLLTECVRLISFGSLRGLKDTKFPAIASFIGFWCIAFPAAYLLAFKFKFGGTGIWWGMVIGLFIAGMMLLIRFNRLVKRVDLVALVTKSE